METSGTAVIATVSSVSKIPKADFLQVANVLGYQVIVGINVKVGDIGIFFQEGLQLSSEYATANDLVRYKKPDGSHGGGFFDITRRVKALKLRGVKSEGYFASLGSLKFIGANIPGLRAGDRISTLNGVPICNKFITEATLRRRAATQHHGNPDVLMFKRHFETDQLRMNMHRIGVGDLLTVTLKMHGTSQRTGYVLVDQPLTRWQRFKKRLGFDVPTHSWSYITGSRNVAFRKGCNQAFRLKAAALFEGKLHKGETVYYEIVGYESKDAPIMGVVKTDLPEHKKLYGDRVTYTYGCENGESAVYVYRITQTNEDGYSVDLSWRDVKHRCAELGVAHVPEMIPPFVVPGDAVGAGIDEAMWKDLLATMTNLGDGPDPVDPRHPCEGVCVRVNSRPIFKHKSWTFGVLEGYIKTDANYVDAEEAA